MAYMLIYFAEKMHLQKLLAFFFSKNTCELDTVLTKTVKIFYH